MKPFCFVQTLRSSLTENTITAPKIEWLIHNRCCSTIRSQLNSRTPDPPESLPSTSFAASLFLYPILSLFLSFFLCVSSKLTSKGLIFFLLGIEKGFPFVEFQLMIVVDYGGSIFPIIAHAPWNGIHLADLVMPFFLFIAGISLALVYKVPIAMPLLFALRFLLFTPSINPIN